jgi:hypothetical protein
MDNNTEQMNLSNYLKEKVPDFVVGFTNINPVCSEKWGLPGNGPCSSGHLRWWV